MTAPAPLVAPNDYDLLSWQAGDQNTFLSFACAQVRTFCGWHIAPTLSVTGETHFIGADGVTMLRSTYVTSIDAVVVGESGNQSTLAAVSDYTWVSPKGWLRIHPQGSVPQTTYAWLKEMPVALSYTHGYDTTPLDVKAVIFELMSTAMELPASNATEVTTEHYRYALNKSIGMTLSQDQMMRLGPYRLRNFGGMVRP